MRKILLVSSSRAERGLLDPVMIELKTIKDIEAKWFFFESTDPIPDLISGFDAYLKYFKPDIVLCPCDRFEMVYPAARAFHQGYIVAHFHAGNNPTNHPDDINRRAISCFSHIMFCNMPQHKANLVGMGEEDWRIYAVGSTAFDGVIFDDSLTPKEAFNLVILHPNPLSRLTTTNDLGLTITTILESESEYKHTIWIYPNHDANYDIIEEHLDTLEPNERFAKYRNLPRNQYFSLLKNCSRAIGNSSSFYYEMPVLDSNQKLMQIGERNKGLVVPSTVTGGSKRIAIILANIPIDDNLRRKKINLCEVT